MPPIALLLEKLAAAGISVPAGPLRADGYGDSAELSEALLELIRSGAKRAGTGLRWAMEHDGDTLPIVGDIEIVVDHRFEPALVTRITRVAYFSPSWTAFQADRGRDFSVIVDGVSV